LYVFRYVSNLSDSLVQTAIELEGKTLYQKYSVHEAAPFKADCLTSIYYIYKKALNITLPLTYIGDVPRTLLSENNWKALKIPLEEAQCGDLIFVKNKDKKKLLSHVALIIDNKSIFHCSSQHQKAVIQKTQDFFALYEQKLNFLKMVHYIDPRNEEMRKKHNGIFIDDEENPLNEG
jgi:cell wall-associated NlpC family hydrolase